MVGGRFVMVQGSISSLRIRERGHRGEIGAGRQEAQPSVTCPGSQNEHLL